jgi:RNA polymerase sigma-70 factor, ECF subfamily
MTDKPTSPDPSEFERDLIERARGGDEAALEALVRANSERLLASVRAELGKRLRQRLESQDIVQQVYLDVLKNIDKFEETGHDSFFRWLRTIALHRICDTDRQAFKAVKRRGEVRIADVARMEESVAGLLDQLPASLTGPLSSVNRAEQLGHLRQALEKLDEDHREVLRLRYLNQLSVEETAAEMERSEAAIRGLCARAVIRLQELLKHVV